MTYPKWLTSSVDPTALGLTVKGILVGLVPAVLVLAGVSHWNLGADQLNAIVDATVNVVVTASTALSTAMVLVGLIRKALVGLGWIKPYSEQNPSA